MADFNEGLLALSHYKVAILFKKKNLTDLLNRKLKNVFKKKVVILGFYRFLKCKSSR